MSTELRRRDDDLPAESGGIDGLTVAKWGLMGLGALVVVKFALGLLLSPLGIGALVLGGGGYLYLKSRSSEPSGEATAAPTPPRVDRVDHANTTNEDALTRSEQELADFDRRMREIERMKAEIGRS